MADRLATAQKFIAWWDSLPGDQNYSPEQVERWLHDPIIKELVDEQRGIIVTAYYNEIDPYAAQWLRNLIDAGHIAPGDVDERSSLTCEPTTSADTPNAISSPASADGPTHSASPDGPTIARLDRLLSLSAAFGAGQRKAMPTNDTSGPLFTASSPSARLQSSLESRLRALGREWLAGVRADLEALGYACGAADLCAAGVGAPQEKQGTAAFAAPIPRAGGA
jgi:DNA (cytosine-5)-methyltransferase 1